MKITKGSVMEKDSMCYKSWLMKEVVMRNRLTGESTHQDSKVLVVARVLVALLLFFTPFAVNAFTLNVVGCDSSNTCNLPVSGFRWLLEEDNTIQTPPGVRVGNSISLSIHNSHAPVVATGEVSGTSTTTIAAPNPSQNYVISVLPASGFSLGGTTIAAGQATANVYVHQYPIPTAQISVFVFKDHDPINNIPDAVEVGLPNFTILVFDQAGQMSQDAFGNPLGTTYNADGTVLAIGTGVITTDATGNALVKYLTPGKYGIRAVPPGDPSPWIQTATIEGTPGVDAWVKANEPPLFIEGFGTGFKHVFIGFVNPSELTWAIEPPVGTTTSISGRNVYNHFGRPPNNQGFFAGPPVSECWVGLNDLARPTGKGLAAVPCDGNSNFTIQGVPPGTYQLVTWDKPLDALFGFNAVVVPDTNPVQLGNVLSFRWFGTFEGSVFIDTNRNGFRDAGEVGIESQVLNLRFRDGSMYQTTRTDTSGEYQFAEVFPFFKWLVAEVDYTRFRPTGMTTAVDYGGAIPPANGWITPSFGVLNPQPQTQVNPNTGNSLSKTETGPVLLEAMMLFLNQTNVIDWGKVEWGAGENGGIAGIVYYSTTRAENDPRLARNEAWEPAIPRVQVNLYRSDGNGNIVDLNGNGQIDLADVDNYPLGWGTKAKGKAGKMGPEDVNRNGSLTGSASKKFNQGDAVAVTWTDSWDDNKPTGCIQDLPPIDGVQPCFDNYGTWNQVRPGVFDGGYAFGFLAGEALAPGNYIIEVVPPPGYMILKEEDKNVDFGDEYIPGTLAEPPACVGTFQNTGVHHIVPPYLTLFPAQQIPAHRAGEETPLCTMKEVSLAQGQNAAADFFMFTEVPKAARVVGFANNDLTAEFRASSPIFGEKSSPSWIPVSFQDWQGTELTRVYSDEFGSYNAMLPSTFTVNVPVPSGVSPNIITLVLNHPFLPDGTIDPFYDSKYSVTPWSLDYWPGKTLYADTPLVPLSAFTVVPQNGPDVQPATRTPVIKSVDGNSPNGGPVVCSTPAMVTITSLGSTQVPNPDFDPSVSGSQALVTRDYGFGTVQGTVVVGTTPLTVTSWIDAVITAQVPAGATTGQLMITRGDNSVASEVGITLHVSIDACATVRWVLPAATGTPIQNAIDAANPGELIIVKPGTYRENPILYKPLKLQGTGEGSTIIFANPSPADRLQAWHAKIQGLLGNDPFIANEAPGIMVLGTVPTFTFDITNTSLIDGFKIFGALQGGGIFVNTNVDSLTISNNRINGNQGNWGGGIAVGTPDTGTSNLNPNLKIVYNRILQNGGVQGGGGIVINDGADNYLIANNIIGGNFARFNGGGISHVGLSDNGLIMRNRIIFNETAFGGAAFTEGAGIFVGSSVPVPLVVPPPPVVGAGNVTINSNLIQGNLSGVGNGGGISVAFFNGQDVIGNPLNPDPWYKLNIFNNMIVNNTAGVAGGGIALQDAVAVNIVNNTIVNNDSTATGANAFAAGAVDSTPQGAGIVSSMHSADIATASGQTFANPLLQNNIIRNNRSFYTTNGGAGGLLANPVDPVWDLSVKGATTPTYMNPQYNLLTSLISANDGAIYDTTNITTTNRIFFKSYVNQLLIAAVIDEGGNFITVRHTQVVEGLGNYHLRPDSPAIDAGNDTTVGSFPELAKDFDSQVRPHGTKSDLGADEYYTPIFSEVILFSPDGGEIIDELSVFEILWGAPAPAVNPAYSKFSLHYSIKGGKGWKAIKGAKKINGASDGVNFFNWTVPKINGNVNKDNCLVRVTAFDSKGKKTGFFDISDAPFTIRQVLP
jgi:hypothetical protein